MMLAQDYTSCHAARGTLVMFVENNVQKLRWPTKSRPLIRPIHTQYLIRALIPYHGDLLLLLSHVVNLCCVEGLIEDKCISNKHSR